MDRDGKRIVREWNREIEVEDRRLAAARQDGWGKIVAWTVLDLMWLVVVFAVLALITRLPRPHGAARACVRTRGRYGHRDALAIRIRLQKAI